MTAPPPEISRREFALGAAFLAASATAAAALPREKIDLLGKATLPEIIPEQIGSWRFVSSSGLVVPPEDQLSRHLYSQLLTRVYSRPDGAQMMLLIAQSGSQTGILQVHRPEICYTAGGYVLSETHRHTLRLAGRNLPAVALAATADGRNEQIVYWTRIGHHLPSSWAEQRKAVAIDNLNGFIPDAVLVRVSTIDRDDNAAKANIDQFIIQMFVAVAPATRHFLLG